MMQPSSFYEIELKALLSKEQYDKLYCELPKKMKMINKERIHTTRYRPGDIRLRHSDKILEIVCKEGNPAMICRKEVKIPLASQEQLKHFAEVFNLLGMQADPQWIKDKYEFEYFLNGFTYIICLQNIHNFAYILEVEFLSEIDSSKIHEPNIRKIISELGCEPIEPGDFSERIKEYINQNKVD